MILIFLGGFLIASKDDIVLVGRREKKAPFVGNF
jgi:hypothetical protein